MNTKQGSKKIFDLAYSTEEIRQKISVIAARLKDADFLMAQMWKRA